LSIIHVLDLLLSVGACWQTRSKFSDFGFIWEMQDAVKSFFSSTLLSIT
jgi:hypothetical protein